MVYFMRVFFILLVMLLSCSVSAVDFVYRVDSAPLMRFSVMDLDLMVITGTYNNIYVEILVLLEVGIALLLLQQQV